VLRRRTQAPSLPAAGLPAQHQTRVAPPRPGLHRQARCVPETLRQLLRCHLRAARRRHRRDQPPAQARMRLRLRLRRHPAGRAALPQTAWTAPAAAPSSSPLAGRRCWPRFASCWWLRQRHPWTSSSALRSFASRCWYATHAQAASVRSAGSGSREKSRFKGFAVQYLPWCTSSGAVYSSASTYQDGPAIYCYATVANIFICLRALHPSEQLARAPVLHIIRGAAQHK